MLANDRATTRIARLVGDSLVDHGEDLAFVPRLAEGWDVSEDGTRITFHLREGVLWHDGKPFTSSDVLFTFGLATDPEIGAGVFNAYFGQVSSVEAPDERTVVVTYRAPFSPALQGWESLLILPRHRFEPGADVRDHPFGRAPIGTGPYRFVEWRQGQQIVLEANPGYWRGRPHLDRLIFRIVPDLRTAFGALIAGELDMARVPAGEQLPDGRWRTVRSPSLRVSFIAWQGNGSNPFFGDPRVRRAMTLALDRQGFLETVLDGQGVPATSTFVPGTWAHDDDLAPLPLDPGASARLLDEAGWRREGPDGLRVRDGIPFRFTLNVLQRNRDGERMALLLEDALRRLGVAMTIERLDWPVFLERLHARDFEAQLSTWSLDVDPDPYDFWHSSQIPEGMNYTGYADPEVDAWCEAGRRTFDRGERARLYRKVQERLHRDQPFTFLYHPGYELGLSSRLEDLRISPAGVWDWYPAALDWWVPRDRQRYGGGVP